MIHKSLIINRGSPRLFQEYEEHREDQAGESRQVVPLEGLALEEEVDDDREDGQRDGFLDDLELHQIERAAVARETDAVGGDGEAVLEEGDAPGEQDDQDQRPAGRDLHFLQFEMAVPRERHEDVRADQHQDGPDSLHTFVRKVRKDTMNPGICGRLLRCF